MNDSILLFLKVAKTEYINDLTKNGVLYLSLADEFRNQKRYGGKKYDSEEGSLSAYDRLYIDVGNSNFNDPNKILDCSNAKMKGNECIYCLKIILKSELGDKGIEVPYEFFNNLIGDNNWSEYSLLVIKNIHGFLDTIEQAAKKGDYTYRCNMVQYDNHFFESPYSFHDNEFSIETYFHKREKFKEQSEYRILLQNDKHEDLKLQIDTSFFTDANYVQLDNLQSFNQNKPILLI